MLSHITLEERENAIVNIRNMIHTNKETIAVKKRTPKRVLHQETSHQMKKVVIVKRILKKATSQVSRSKKGHFMIFGLYWERTP